MNKFAKFKNNPTLPLAKIWEACTFIIPSDKLFLQGCFLLRFHKLINWDNPKTFNEKMQWLKIYDRNPRYTNMVDKYSVREIVKEKVEMFELLGVWDSFDEIDFDTLPNQFVLKTTHDSGRIIFCKDKKQFDYAAARKHLTRALKHDYFKEGREFPYKNVKRRIIAEKYMEMADNKSLTDYKLMCFNGKVEMTFVVTERFEKDGAHISFYDREWHLLPFRRDHPLCRNIIPKPYNYEEMVRLAESFSKDIPFLRVDFYEIENKLYFGEFTFYAGGGMERFQPEEADYIYGEKLKLPINK